MALSGITRHDRSIAQCSESIEPDKVPPARTEHPSSAPNNKKYQKYNDKECERYMESFRTPNGKIQWRCIWMVLGPDAAVICHYTSKKLEMREHVQVAHLGYK